MTQEIIYQPDHLAEALAVLLSQYRDKTRIVALVGALIAGVQTLEDTAFDVLVGTTFDVATEGTLDQWGVILGEPREDLDDGGYRDLLRAKLQVLRSNGTVPAVIRTWIAMNPDADEAWYRTAYPAGYRLHLQHDVALTDTQLARLLRLMDQVRPAGVNAEYTETTAGGFRFDIAGRGFDGPPMGRRLA